MTDNTPDPNETTAPGSSETTAPEPSETTASEPSRTTSPETATEDTRRVTLPDHVGAEIDRRVSETEFDSADEYVTFVLESLFRELDQRDGNVVVAVREEDPDDTERVQNQLESLGYL